MTLTKKSFLEVLTSYDPKEINELIKSKGKEPKMFSPMIYVGEEEKNNLKDN